MPFRIDCGPEHPVIAALAELGGGPHAAAVLAKRSGLSVMDLFDELDVLELAGCLRWSTGDDTHDMLAIELTDEPQSEPVAALHA